VVRGLNHFKEYFREYSENFILVGGVASYLLLSDVGASRVRPTKDLDIVLILKPSETFLRAFKAYIVSGGYEIQKGGKGRVLFYRFQNPANKNYPLMIELFSAAEFGLELTSEQYIIPVAQIDGVQSLSAILLDEEYYSLIRKNAVEREGIYILNVRGLIPFKAKAYLEIKGRGEDSKNWKKHRSDIINLAVTLLSKSSSESLTGKVKEHFEEFMVQLETELTPEIIQGACHQSISKQEIIDLLKKTFLGLSA
jgi:hypothetical protein